MTNSLVRVVLLLLTALTACSDLTGPRAELTEARERWQSRRLRDYNYNFQRTCFCLHEVTLPVTIAVRGGVVSSVWYLSNREPVPAEHLQFYPTVDELFEQIEDAIAQDAAHLEVEYDRTTGHPTRIDIDYSRQMADDEMFIRAWELYQPHMPQGGAR